MLKAVAYGRVSSEEQKETGTISMQQGMAAAWCQREGVELAGEYLDEDVSGTVMLTDRPAGSRLLADAPRLRAQGVSLVLLYDWSRLGRDPVVVWDAVRLLERVHGLRIRSLTEQADTSTPEAVLMLCVQAGVASYERAKIRERMMHGKRMLAAAGAWLGGAPPYGYRVEGVGRGNARLVLDEREIVPTATGELVSPARVARQLFAWSAAGETLERLCDRLNEWGVPPRAGVKRDGTPLVRLAARWTTARVHQLLVNPVYQGELTYGRNPQGATGEPQGVVVARVTPLVSPETFRAARAALTRNRTTARRNAQRPYLLRGLLKCGRCGHSLIGRYVPPNQSRQQPDSAGYLYYSCAGRKRDGRPLAEVCHLPSLNASAEGELWAAVAAVLRNPEEALGKLREKQEQANRAGKGVAAERERREGELAARVTQREQVISAWRRGLLTEAEMLKERALIAAEERALEAKLAALGPEEADAERLASRYQDAHRLLSDLGARLDPAPTFAERRRILEVLVEQVDVDFLGSGRSRQARMEIVWRFEGGV